LDAWGWVEKRKREKSERKSERKIERKGAD